MLKGPRLTLRAITRDDLPRYVSWLNDPEVTEHLAFLPPFNLDDETNWYEAQRKDSTVVHFALDTEEGVHIGSVSLMSIDYRTQKAELGIVIGPKAERGKGYSREAIELALGYAFETLNLNRVFLRVDADHHAAIRCYRRCGFVTEGELRQVEFGAGAFFNQFIMSILKTEYYRQKKEHGESSEG